MIPTSIDGTDITGATIDGTEVTEITVDGQTVFEASSFPSSLVHRYDPSAESFSDGATVNTLIDQIGSADGTRQSGSPTFRTNEINGEPTIEFFGSEVIKSNLSSSMDNPFSFTCLIYNDLPTSSHTAFGGDPNSGGHPRLRFRPDTDEATYDGGSQANTADLPGYGPLSNAYGIISIVADGSTTTLRVNANQVFSANAGTDGFDAGVSLGRDPRSFASPTFDGFYGEINFYDAALTSQEVTDEENRIAAKYGITL